MVLNFSAKQIFSYDAEKAPFDLSEKYMKIIDGLMSFPLNVPGTAYHKCSKVKKSAKSWKKSLFINTISLYNCMRYKKYMINIYKVLVTLRTKKR